VRDPDTGTLGPFASQGAARFALTEFPSPYLTGLLLVDPERSTYAVAFADRRLERAWQRRALGYEEVVASAPNRGYG
jgi:hypothetical protein